MRVVCRFGGEGQAHFDDLGIVLYWLAPGKPMAIYPHEAGQEDFLVLRGSGAGVPTASASPDEAYASFGEPQPGPPPEILSPPAQPAESTGAG